MNLSLPVTQTNNAQNQPSTTHPEPDKRTPLLRGGLFNKKKIYKKSSLFVTGLYRGTPRNRKI
jgi:hypothetical protein